MSFVEERTKKYYAEQSDGVPKNPRMNGFAVRHRKRDALVYFYIKGAKYVKLPPKFENYIRRFIEQRRLDKDLEHCDFAQTFIEKDSCYEIVEWSSSLRLRQAIRQYGVIIRAMRVKITKKLHTKFVFHVLLEE